MYDVGNEIKRQRISLELTQQELANFSKVSERTIRRIERGGDCKVSTLETLVEALEEIKKLREGEEDDAAS